MLTKTIVKTINDWDAIQDRSDKRLKLFTIPGTKRKMLLRSDVGAYLAAFASEYHQQIAPIDEGTFDDWAWAPMRTGRASSSISDHCAGVAIDINATLEGSQSKSNTYWATHPIKAMRMKKLLAKYSLLEWGGHYKNFYDPMHLVIKEPNAAGVQAEMKKLGILASGKIRTKI